MSYLAIGSVTKALVELLTRKLNKPPLLGSGVSLRVTTVAPDDDRVDQADGVNLFLYKTSESPFARNMDWRGDPTNPTPMKRQPLALTLTYLLTAYAKKGDATAQDDITAHQILGNALTVLHENPVLNDIHDGDFDADLNTNFADELRNSFEKIKITPLPISMEEFSKIWTGLSKAYRLSVAYEVSLVQIAPTSVGPFTGPPVQRTSLGVATIGIPEIASITPSSGPVGTDISITGGRFKTPGMATKVIIAGETLSEADLTKLTNNEIVVRIPEAPSRGPSLPVVVSVNDRESKPAFYQVTPWIDSISPLRGIAGVPITIPFDPPAGATVSATVGGVTASTTVDAANKLVQVLVPATLTANGPNAVVLTVNAGVAQRSNTCFFELTPAIVSVTVTSVGTPAKTIITVNGSRLNGEDVVLKYGTLSIKAGENLTADKVTVDVARVLPANQTLSMLVDGRESNVLPPQLDHVDPPEALSGDEIKIFGSGLSGQAVSVSFGATSVNLGAQPYASQVSVTVPALAAGTVVLKITVDGNDTGSVNFKVLA
jgi:hypothetical protein